MLKRHHRFFQSMQAGRDGLCAGLAFALAFGFRFGFPELWPFEAPSDTTESWSLGIAVMLLWPLLGGFLDVYRSYRGQGLARELGDVFKTTALTLLVLVTLTYFVREVRFSRGVLGVWALLAPGFIGLARLMTRRILRAARRRGHNLRYAFVVGTGRMAEATIARLTREDGFGIRILGIVAESAERACALQDEGGFLGHEVVGDAVAWAQDISTDTDVEVDQILVALPLQHMDLLPRMMASLARSTADVRWIPDTSGLGLLNGSIESLGGLPVVNLQATPLMGWSLVGKRMFDLALVVLGLALIWPLVLLLAVLVRLSSPGPIFFAQERVGMDGQRFSMLKFRTMRMDAEAQGAQMTAAQDDRCTPIGRWLRKLSLDELPQLINVLRGEMSLVGPRPERPCFVQSFVEDIPRYALRHKVKAGMTGWAQLHGLRGNTSIRDRIDLDLYYIEHWSLGLDLKILLRTVLGGFLSRHAY